MTSKVETEYIGRSLWLVIIFNLVLMCCRTDVGELPIR